MGTFRKIMVLTALWAIGICAADSPLADWKFKWEFEYEAQSKVAYVKEHIKKAEDHLEKGGGWNNWWAGYHFRKVHKKSRSLTNRGYALLGQAVAYYRREKPNKASELVMKAVEHYANFIDFDRAVQFEYLIASRYFHGQRDWTLASQNDRAVKIYDHLVKYAPYLPIAPMSLSKAGDLHRLDGTLHQAIRYYDRFLTRYPQHELVNEVRLNLIDALLSVAELAESETEMEKRARAQLAKAKLSLKGDKYAGVLEAFADRADHIEAKHWLFLGKFYQRKAHYNRTTSARYLKSILEKYPDSEFVEDAQAFLDKLPADVKKVEINNG